MLAKRDLGVILLALLGVYFSLQNEGVVSFHRAWHVPGDALAEDDFDADPISHRAKDAHERAQGVRCTCISSLSVTAAPPEEMFQPQELDGRGEQERPEHFSNNEFYRFAQTD